ncbi:hypothetical protein F4677DRAFT_17822 [Hypoxylon crocopeplum]|nr:hypothetical protein F4677DRAFT_17822 [Hypoxylon crocopeplum]
MAAPNLPPPSDTPQYAVFDDSSKKDADALPAMPSWDGAKSQKVLVEDEPVEMEPLKKPENNQNTALNAFAMNAGAVSHPTSPSPVSPEGRSPYGPPPGQGGPNGYMAAAQAEADPYSTNKQGYNQYDHAGYGQTYGQASHDNVSQGYGMAAAAVGSQASHQDYNNGYGRGGMDQGYPQSRTPRPYNDEYGRSGTPGSYGAPPSYRTAPSATGAYSNSSRMASPAPQAGYGYGNGNASRMRSPGPQIGFEYPPRSQTTTPGSYNRQYPPAPQRQYSNESTRPLARPPPERQYSNAADQVSPIQNAAGFDFSSGYSRPATAGASQPQSANGGTAYPGYRTYRPQGGAQQDNWNGV